MAEPLPNDSDRPRSQYVDAWLSKELPSDLKIAALAYLGDCGRTDDLIAIGKELESGDHKTTYAAVDAILRIKLRDGRENAIRSLIELQPESVRPALLRKIFENGSSIETSLLTECLGHRNPDVRRASVSVLRQLRKFDVSVVDRLLLDQDAGVRYEAIQALSESGRTFSDSEANSILVRPNAGAALGNTDFAGERNLARWRHKRLTEMGIAELEEEVSREFILDKAARFELSSRQFSKYGDGLRQAIDDGFKKDFDEDVAQLEALLGIGNETTEKIKSLERYTLDDRIRKALTVLCQKQ